METFTDQEIEYAKAYLDLNRQVGGHLTDSDWDRLRKIRSPWGIDIRRSNQIVKFVGQYGLEAMRQESHSNKTGNYTLVLKSAGSALLPVIKLVKEKTGLGLKESKE